MHRSVTLDFKRGRPGLLAAGVCLLFMILCPHTFLADTAYGYILPDSARRVYYADELMNMPLQVLCYAKNEIYARNGRMFQSSELQNYFAAQHWYTALYQPDQFTSEMLNVYEQENLMLLSNLEAQAGMYTLDSPGYTYDAVYEWLEGDGGIPATSDMAETAKDPYFVDPDSYIFYDSDKRYLSKEETAEMTAQEICYARYEIYARRGRLFHSQELTDYFEQKNWYWGYLSAEMVSDAVLNEFEKANTALLAEAENEAVDGGYILDQPGYSFETIGSYTVHQTYTDSVDQYIIWDSSIRYLTREELKSYSLREICYARNEIFARRGYVFQKQELREYFGSKAWYQPQLSDTEFSSSLFNVYEKANVELLGSIEYSEAPEGYALY